MLANFFPVFLPEMRFSEGSPEIDIVFIRLPDALCRIVGVGLFNFPIRAFTADLGKFSKPFLTMEFPYPAQ